MDKYLSISKAASLLGVSISTLRRWDNAGKLVPEKTAGGQRRYKYSQLRPFSAVKNTDNQKTIAYARVSSHDQKEDLERQKQILELYCAIQRMVI